MQTDSEQNMSPKGEEKCNNSWRSHADRYHSLSLTPIHTSLLIHQAAIAKLQQEREQYEWDRREQTAKQHALLQKKINTNNQIINDARMQHEQTRKRLLEVQRATTQLKEKKQKKQQSQLSPPILTSPNMALDQLIEQRPPINPTPVQPPPVFEFLPTAPWFDYDAWRANPDGYLPSVLGHEVPQPISPIREMNLDSVIEHRSTPLAIVSDQLSPPLVSLQEILQQALPTAIQELLPSVLQSKASEAVEPEGHIIEFNSEGSIIEEEEEVIPTRIEMNTILADLDMTGTILHRYVTPNIIPTLVYKGLTEALKAKPKASIFYRGIDRNVMTEHNPATAIDVFNNVMRYSPETSPGTRLYPSVISYALNDTVDTSQIKHQHNGRFHILIRNNLVATANTAFMTNTVDFNILSLQSTRFATLTMQANDRSHEGFDYPISQCVSYARSLLLTGGLGGYDPALVATLFSRFRIIVIARGQANPWTYPPITLQLRSIELLLADDDLVTVQLAVELEDEYVQLIKHMFGENYEDEDDAERNDEEEFDDVQILSKVEKVIFKFMPRTIFRNKALDISNYPRHTIHDIERQIDIEHAPEIADPLPPTVYDITRDKRMSSSEREEEDRKEAEIDNNANEDVLPVGCVTGRHDKLETALARLSQIWSPPNNLKNDCFIDCLRESTSRKFQSRDELGITHDNHINEKDMYAIALRRHETYHLYVIKETQYHEKSLMLQRDPEEGRISQRISLMVTINGSPEETSIEQHSFLIHHHHCYLIKGLALLLKKVKCSTCSQWINRETFKKHIDNCSYCVKCRRAYHTTPHTCREPPNSTVLFGTTEIPTRPTEQNAYSWTRMTTSPLGKKITPSNKIWFSDIEAFPNDRDEFTPYGISLLCLTDIDYSNRVEIFYGEDCLERYFERLAQIQGTLYYFNGSGFDNFLHLKAMVDQSLFIDNRQLIFKGSRIMKFNHHSKLKVHDLYLFIQSSLKDACHNWGVPTQFEKTEFNHSKVRNHATALEHEEEVTEYLKLDTLALGHLFRIYHQTMWKCFSMDMNLCISPSQYAIQTWTAGNPHCNEIYIPHAGKEEKDDRAAYYGGRVMCQYKAYESESYDERLHTYQYDEIEDYLVLGDVNSLYPAAQRMNQYAIGKWKYVAGGDEYLRRLNAMSPRDEDWLLRTCFHVNVECPKDLITAFLMERDNKGYIQHTLHDKEAQWYWGCELQEAIILGYKVTLIIEMKTFEKREYIFDKYVTKCWEGRKNSMKGSAQNLAFKFAMNALTGKFGQASFATNKAIYTTDYEPSKKMEQHFQEMIEKVMDFEPVFSADGYNSALILEIANDEQGPKYPIYLSAQILAYARVHMSRIMRICDSYRDWARAIYYTDTDSLVLPAETLPALEAASFIGNELGQLKCDLTDATDLSQWGKIVRGIWSATKGPYSLVYVRPEGPLMEKVRAKGIPHCDKPFPHHDPLFLQLDQPQEQLLEQMQAFIDDPLHAPLPAKVIAEKFYLYKDLETSHSYAAKHINYDIIEQIMTRKGELYALYGGMKRCFQHYNGDILLVKPDIVQRMACRTDWWQKGKRVFKEGQSEMDMFYSCSYPPGYAL